MTANQAASRTLRILLGLALAFSAACSSSTPTDSERAESDAGESTPSETDTDQSDLEESSPDAVEAGEELSLELQFTLPSLPQDFDNPSPASETGVPMDPDDLNTDSRWLWCIDDGDTTLGRAVIGDIWNSGVGAGVVIEFYPDLLEAGSTISFPTEDFVVFLVDLHGREGIPEEYASNQEESFGSLELTSVPCLGESDELAFTVDGGIGPETNPGFVTAAAISGSFRMGLTDPPPVDLFGG